jgi:co-chaperonin GroES (HSP10)
MSKKIKRVHTFGEHVLVKIDKVGNETASGIILTDVAPTASTGTIASVGPGRVTDQGVTIPMICKPGDRVMFPPVNPEKSVKSVKIDEVDYMVLPESHLIGIMEEYEDE